MALLANQSESITQLFKTHSYWFSSENYDVIARSSEKFLFQEASHGQVILIWTGIGPKSDIYLLVL